MFAAMRPKISRAKKSNPAEYFGGAFTCPHGGEFALPQLVAIDDYARSARHIVEGAALDKRVYARVTEQDQRRTIIKAARISGDLPSLREQLLDRQRCLRCRQAGRRQHRCQVEA